LGGVKHACVLFKIGFAVILHVTRITCLYVFLDPPFLVSFCGIQNKRKKKKHPNQLQICPSTTLNVVVTALNTKNECQRDYTLRK